MNGSRYPLKKPKDWSGFSYRNSKIAIRQRQTVAILVVLMLLLVMSQIFNGVTRVSTFQQNIEIVGPSLFDGVSPNQRQVNLTEENAAATLITVDSKDNTVNVINSSQVSPNSVDLSQMEQPSDENNVTLRSLDIPQLLQQHPNTTHVILQSETSPISQQLHESANKSNQLLRKEQHASNVSVAAIAPDYERRQRLKATLILDLLSNSRLNTSHVPLLFPKPPVDSYNISAIYSRKAWIELREMLYDGNKETILVANGGSSTAGAGNVLFEDRFYHLFASAFSNVTTVDRAHGCRNSMHSAHVMHTFLPMHTDVVLWEFALNDEAQHQTSNKTLRKQEARNQMTRYLEQVARVAKQRKQARPPLVIIVYFWNTHQFVDTMKRPDLVFEAHRGVVEQYDFVVGHVNAAKYYEPLWSFNATQTYFMSDESHPNTLSHHVVAHLLQDLVTNENRSEIPKGETQPSFVWGCGDETPQKRRLRDLVENKHAIASFTPEEPKNQQVLPGMLLPLVDNEEIKIESIGRSISMRSDRKYVAILPCCETSMMSFDHVWHHGVLQGIQFVVYPNETGLSLHFDDRNVTDHIFNCKTTTEWECLFGDIYGIFSHWAVLQAPENVSSIRMCNHLPGCSSNASHVVALETLTVYGDSLS